MGPPSYTRLVVDRNVVMRRTTTFYKYRISKRPKSRSLPNFTSLTLLQQSGFWCGKT